MSSRLLIRQSLWIILIKQSHSRTYFRFLVFSIITAFVVDMFMYEYTIQKNKKLDSAVEAKIKELGLGIDADT